MTQDRRIRRTQKLLGEALIAESLDKGYKNLTIQDVTNRADIGYRTYFRHYTGLDELLISVAQDRLDEFYEILDLPLPGEMIADPVEFFHQIGLTLFQHIKENQETFRFLLLDDSSRFVLEPVMNRACAKAEILLKELPQENIPAGVAANHIVSSAFSLMRWWLENEMRHSPQKMSEIFTDLIIKPTWLVMTRET
ncbi:MAG: TetR-like C-terminal domain-containing protein [Anaerolineales bacterium]|nr:TetR-like C-terminal domain-containing protein [Anaerolineales bacterium]